jgi:hypothetical protein
MNFSQTRSPNAGKGTSPYKENNNNCPRALLYFFYGEKNQGSQAMEAEMKKGSQFDEGLSGVTNSLLMQGTPTVPFGDYMNGGTTPLRDRADTQQHNMPSASKFSVSNNMQRAVSSEQKGIHAVSGAFNQISINSGAIPSDSRN